MLILKVRALTSIYDAGVNLSNLVASKSMSTKPVNCFLRLFL